MKGSQDRSRISEAFDELSGYRDDGEDVIENLQMVAEFHSVPVSKLRELAEQKWGVPLENDRERNAKHFEVAARRNAERNEAQAYRTETIRNAKEAALEVWTACSPSGAPDWSFCSKRFLSLNKIENASLRQEVEELFLKVGKDFQKSVALYNKWMR